MANEPRRLQLHSIFQAIQEGVHVYHQPPATIQMVYPCILYMRDSDETMFADNSPYRRTKRYQVTVLDKDPDSTIPDAIAALPLCKFDRHFVVDNLHHDVFNIFF